MASIKRNRVNIPVNRVQELRDVTKYLRTHGTLPPGTPFDPRYLELVGDYANYPGNDPRYIAGAYAIKHMMGLEGDALKYTQALALQWGYEFLKSYHFVHVTLFTTLPHVAHSIASDAEYIANAQWNDDIPAPYEPRVSITETNTRSVMVTFRVHSKGHDTLHKQFLDSTEGLGDMSDVANPSGDKHVWYSVKYTPEVFVDGPVPWWFNPKPTPFGLSSTDATLHPQASSTDIIDK